MTTILKTTILFLILSAGAIGQIRIVTLPAPPLDQFGNLLSGYVALGNGYYDVDPRANLGLPGIVILGTGPNRYRDLTGAQKRDCLISRVTRVVEGQPTEVRVRIRDEAGGDVILETNIVPHKWLGEP